MRAVGLARMVGLALTAGLVLALTGCGEPAYRFVSSKNHDLVMRVPRSWSPVDTNAALKASGIDPSTQTGWTAFYDGSPKPTAQHMANASTDAPILFAESIPLTKEQSASVTGADLRELMLPGSPEERAAAVKAKTFAILESNSVSSKTEAGAHIRYSYKIGDTNEIFDRIALTDPKHTTVQVAFVHCSESCYAAHADEIDDVVTSLTLKPHH